MHQQPGPATVPRIVLAALWSWEALTHCCATGGHATHKRALRKSMSKASKAATLDWGRTG